MAKKKAKKSVKKGNKAAEDKKTAPEAYELFTTGLLEDPLINEEFRKEFLKINYFRRITDDMYDNLLKDYKTKQAEILGQMQDHSEADEQFYITANITLNLAKRAKEIFISSEVQEKQQLLGCLLQNCVLNGKKLEFTLRSPFNHILDFTKQPTWLRG